MRRSTSIEAKGILPNPWEIEDLERIRRVRRSERREEARIPVVDRIRPAVGYVPSIDEEKRGVVTIRIVV